MTQDQPTAPSTVESATCDICTPSATSENTTKNLQPSESPQSSIPWPGRTFIIRSRTNDQVITFLNGEIILDRPGGLGTFRWQCVEKNGWMGFKDPASALYLGFDQLSWLRCAVPHHQSWEYICPRIRPDGGYVLLIRHEEELLPLGLCTIENNNGVKQKVKITNWKAEGIAWDFIKVPIPG
jgi:hypothetical protein